VSRRPLLVLLLLVLAGLGWWFGTTRHGTGPVQVQDLPWQTRVDADGRLTVFGVTLGRTTLRELMQRWHHDPELGLFQDPQGALRLEAYFGKRRLGVFDAYVVARLGADAAQLERWRAGAVSRKAQASGDYKYELNERDLAQALALPVIELTYVPTVNYEPEVVRRRFGEPAEVRALAGGRELWLYPERALAMVLDPKGRDILHYVQPARFEALRARLQ